MLMSFQVMVVELYVGVDSHFATPRKDLVSVSQSHAMVVSKADIFDELGAS